MIISLPVCPACGAKAVNLFEGFEKGDTSWRLGFDSRELKLRKLVFSCGARAQERLPDAEWAWALGCPRAMEKVE